jgi:voltage-gated potassium channel
MRSFFGLVDLLAVLSGWASIVVVGGQVLTSVRVLRLLRVFRVLRLGEYLGEARELGRVTRALHEALAAQPGAAPRTRELLARMLPAAAAAGA